MRTRSVALLIVLLLTCVAGLAQEAGYQLAEGDKIAVSVLRHTELSGAYTVPPDGAIDFPRAGRLPVIGHTTTELAAALMEAWSQLLVKPEVTVVLTEKRLHPAYVLGAVAKPGQYVLETGARITELLAAAGDLVGDRPKLTASLVRGKETIPVALQAALTGDPAANLPLREGDVLWIQAPVLITVVVTGEVKQPGAMKLEQGARLLDALAAAGDLAGDRAKLRGKLMRGTQGQSVDLAAVYAGTDGANLALRDGDLLLIQAPPTITVVVSGAVKNPGPVKLELGGKLLDAVAAAGGLSGEPEKMNAGVIREKQTLPVKLQAALSGADLAANLALHDNDTLVVQAPPKITVTVMGQVKNPGMLRLDVGATLVGAISTAGDITERPERAAIKLIRAGAITPAKYGDNTVVLQDGDVLSVERETMLRVYVNGLVKNPGAFDLLEGGGPLEALALAGGVIGSPALSLITIKRAAGTVEQVNLAAALNEGNVTVNPALRNGDQVIVPESTLKIAVFGGVNKAGVYPVSETQALTIIDAISLAGGETKKAKLKEVVVIRNIDPVTKKAERIKVDVKAILRDGKMEQNIALQPRDVVFVPESGSDTNSLIDNIYRLGILASLL